MNGKRAKALRKIVYQDDNFRVREYVRIKDSLQIINIAQIKEIDVGGGNIKRVPNRRIYRHLKKRVKKTPIKLLEKVILNNENP